MFSPVNALDTMVVKPPKAGTDIPTQALEVQDFNVFRAETVETSSL